MDQFIKVPLFTILVTLYSLTLYYMLLVANLANKNDAEKAEKRLKPLHMGTHLGALSESYPMNTNMTGFRWLSKTLHPCALDEISLRIGNVERIGESQPFSFITFISIRIMIFDSCDTQFSTQLL